MPDINGKKAEHLPFTTTFSFLPVRYKQPIVPLGIIPSSY